MLTVLADTFRIATFQTDTRPARRSRPDPKDEIRKFRSEIRHLDAHLLRDIGLDPDDFEADEQPSYLRWSPR